MSIPTTQSGPAGHFEVASTTDEAVRACGRLDGITALLPDPELFLYDWTWVNSEGSR
ncbi:MAG: hypothetical protein L0H73_08895 [Nitrococcus sp.]|nr:hypothetical protein [Nitrococcus sp.]